MTNSAAALREYFTKLGLEPEVADLYLALQAHGPQSLLQLSRNARVERTRIYRLLDTIKDCHLIEEETHYKRKIYKAAPLTNLQILMTRREQHLLDLRNEMKQLQDVIGISERETERTRVQFYQGADGIKQMMWNETNAKSENLSILYENMQSRTNIAFFHRWAEKCNAAGLTFRGIISDHFIDTQKNWYATHDNERLKQWKARHIPNDVFKIEHSTIIYDNVVAFYDWKDGNIFGTEIYSQHIANTHRQFFEMLWKLGQPIDDKTGKSTAP